MVVEIKEMASSNSFIANVPKLKGRENYSEWAFAAENLLVLEGKLNFLKTEGDGAAITEDAMTKAKLILTIDPSLYVHVKSAATTKELWQKLQQMFDDSGFSRKIMLLRTLISIRLETSDSMTSYITQIIETGQKLSRTGFLVNDEWIGSLMLAGLPEKYFPMLMAIEHSGIAITADVVKSKLLDLTGNEDSAETTALYTRGRQHVNQKSKSFSQSFNRAGHSFKDGEMSNQSNVNKNKQKVIKCYRCKQIGHYKNKCTQVQETKTNGSNAFSAVFLSGNFSRHDYYLDSGASVHITSDVNNIRNASESTSIKEITAANKAVMPVLCSGDVDIVTITPKCKYSITVKDVLCVPTIATNLLSVSKLIENGNKVDFKRKCCNIYNSKNQLVGVARLVDGVYKLNVENKHNCLFTSSDAVKSEQWHRRMGHLNSSDLNKMKEGAILGIDFKDKAVIDKSTCVVCCQGKQSRLPFNHVATRSSEALNIIHADICGPMEVTSIGGCRYFLIFVDDHTRMTFVYFLKAKNQALNCFKDFKALVENQQIKKIKILRTDNGLEFCNAMFDSYLADAGIVHQKTNTYTPEQNAVSERMNRTLVERARCMLFDAGLDKRFWAEAVNTAVYLRNRSPASGLQNTTPSELWTGRKPDLSHIRIFGSQVMVHIPKERRLKWDAKSKPHILVGYAENVKGYRIYDPVKQCVSVSRDVIIQENLKSNISDRISVSVGEISETQQVKREIVESVEPATIAEPENNSDEADDTDQTDANSILQNVDEIPLPAEEEPTKRIRRPPQRYGYSNLCTQPNAKNESDPVTVQQALQGPNRDKWIAAMEEELQAFDDNDAWVVVSEVPQGKSLVRSKWVFKSKLGSDNSVRYRARLVARGFTQKPGIDYDETFSPVVRHSTLRLLFALSVQLNLKVTHLDVKTAFLNGTLKEDIFMSHPQVDLDNNSSKKIVKLNKAIYGLKQSSRSWYEKVDQCLTEVGFKRSQIEPCVYTKFNEDVKVIIALYVDDFFVYSNCNVETDNLISVLSSKFHIKDLGQVKQCLGMRVNIDEKNNTCTLDQEQYIDELLIKFNMLNCKEAGTPMESKLNIDKNDNVNDDSIPYQQLIGSLMYLSVLTRPDIAFSVSFLSQFNACHTSTHWSHAKRILRYLKRTKNYCIRYVKGNCELLGFADADWANNCIDRKSYTGYCFMMSGSIVSWESRKQRTVALSSMEAEYMSMAEACKESMYLRVLLSEVTYQDVCPVTLYNDSQSAQKFVINHALHRKSKHIDIRYNFLKDAVSNNLVKIKYICTNNMPADVLTKALGASKHYQCIEALGLSNL